MITNVLSAKPIMALCLLIGYMADHQARAGLIVTYDLQSASGTELIISPHSTTASQVTGMSLTRGAGLIASTGGSNGTNTFSATGWNSLASNDYISFGFQVDSGYQATVSSVQFRVRAQSGGPANLGLFTSQDNFSSAVSTFNPTQTVASFSLLPSGLQPTQGQLEFRIYALNSEGVDGGLISDSAAVLLGNYNSGRTIEYFQVSGTISSVPEPATYALVSVLASLFLTTRSSRKRL